MCQSIFQSIILFTVVFGAMDFFPEGVEGPNNKETKSGVAGSMPSAAARSMGLTPYDLAKHPNKRVQNWTGEFVINGMLKELNGEDLYKSLYDVTPSRHLTIVFNIFVWLQVFNMLAARKINDELNIFSGVFTNPMFCGVWTVIAVA